VLIDPTVAVDVDNDDDDDDVIAAAAGPSEDSPSFCSMLERVLET